ncbi:Clp protease N-terminal domain-containing protein [Streptomyces sp. NPDC048442]|uniref:Clp protease N-terminal domain-containing protein n=1 Tax=Streptomyces sp. NPDC048442 TaxID=3154823 RepID=UPI0034264D31
MATVVAGARRRAQRDGDRQIDTAHLLHSLLESDPEVRAAFESGSQVARVLGYLVQRSIGYGLRWQSRVEGAQSRVDGAVGVTPVAGWSPAAVAAMEAALARAAERGDPQAGGTGLAGGTDLLAALVGDVDCRAVEVLRRAGVEPADFCRYAGGPSRQA